jgi:hypothetical protein
LKEAKLIYQAQHRTAALKRFRAWKRRWTRPAPKAVACLETDLEELLAFFDCPAAHWKRVRTTNVIERLFVEVRRRIRTMCAFTTVVSVSSTASLTARIPIGPRNPSRLLHRMIDATDYEILRINSPFLRSTSPGRWSKGTYAKSLLFADNPKVHFEPFIQFGVGRQRIGIETDCTVF